MSDIVPSGNGAAGRTADHRSARAAPGKRYAGEYVAIIGAGAIAPMAALSARHYKATPILIDIVEERLRYAQKLGVPYVLNAADDRYRRY